MKSICIGHNNWFKVNYGLDSPSNFSIDSNIQQEVKQINFIEAADYTANLISENYNNIHISLSGGLDSEFVAKTFLKNKLKFTPVVLVNETNEHESFYAFKFCKDNNLTPKILDFRGSEKHLELLKKILIKSAKLNVLPNVSLVPNIIYEYVNSPILTGYGDFFDTIKINDIYTSYKDSCEDLVTIEEHDFYLQLEADIHPAPFFCYTPEITIQLIKEINPNESLQIAKSKLYDLTFRPKINNVLNNVPINNIIKKAYNEKNKKESGRINFNKTYFLNFINKVSNN